MWSKRCCLCFFIFLAMFTSTVFGYAAWNDDGADSLWTTGGNWSTGYMPQHNGESVGIGTLGTGERGPIITSGMTPPTGYTTLVAKNIHIEPPGSQITIMTITGGELVLRDELWLISGAATGTAKLEMTGGSLTVGTDLRVGGTGSDGGIVQLDGGTLDVNTLTIRDNGSVDITSDGKLIIDGDVLEDIQSEVDDGTITAYSGIGRVVIIYNSTDDKTSVTAEVITAGQTVQNPVIYKLADSGAMKHNGEYYAMGVNSDGDMYNSENLVNWGPREHVFSMDNDWATGEAGDDEEIHACDLRYVDGVFHLYWSVNRYDLGVQHIGHATTTGDPMNTYTEPVTSTYFADKIDPHLFIDDDGSMYFYTVKFPSGNVCYGQAMSDPWTRTGTNYSLISAVLGTWEVEDSDFKINEGPAVITYRDKYYMLYAANPTSFASYAIGCVESSGPLSFSNNDKYSDPVLEQLTYNGHSVTHCGQPTLLRGPNGFEWWMIYFASYDSGSRSQAIDRVLFFDNELFVVGPTSNLAAFTTPTYTPPPSAPTFGDLFSSLSATGSYWDTKAGSWTIANGKATQSLTTGSDNKVIIKSKAAKNYLAEVSVELIDEYTPGEKAGITAYYEDANNWMIVALDQKNEAWFYNKMESGTSSVTGYGLPNDFDYNVYHNLRVTKNNSTFRVWIDEIPAPSNPVISTNFTGEGLPGLYTQVARANYDGFIYTIGWDEYDDQITGWGSADAGASQTGSWSTTSNGIEATNSGTTNRTYKGDLLDQYEFMTQITRTSIVPTDANPHTMGVYAIYADSNNWMISAIDLVNDRLKVYGLKDGSAIGDREISINSADSYNMRVIKRNESTRIFIDGELKMTVPITFPDSQVGLRAENIKARYNGIALFKLGSQYGNTAPSNDDMEDNFDDCLFSEKWQSISIHSTDVSKHDHNTLPDIVIHETDRGLKLSGCEKGDDTSAWYGRGLKYLEPVSGDSTMEIDFDSLNAYSDTGAVARASIGLRIWKDQDNWFEVKQKDDDDGDRLQTVTYKNGVQSSTSITRSNTSGSLKIVFDNSAGEVDYYLNDTKEGTADVEGMKNSEYYVYITAYTSNTSNRIECVVDNFEITEN